MRLTYPRGLNISIKLLKNKNMFLILRIKRNKYLSHLHFTNLHRYYVL